MYYRTNIYAYEKLRWEILAYCHGASSSASLFRYKNTWHINLAAFPPPHQTHTQAHILMYVYTWFAHLASASPPCRDEVLMSAALPPPEVAAKCTRNCRVLRLRRCSILNVISANPQTTPLPLLHLAPSVVLPPPNEDILLARY